MRVRRPSSFYAALPVSGLTAEVWILSFYCFAALSWLTANTWPWETARRRIEMLKERRVMADRELVAEIGRAHV